MKTTRIRKNEYFIYSLLFVITAGLSFYAFFSYNHTMVIDPDGYLQHYPLLVRIRHAVKELIITKEFPLWAWDTGLGADFFGNYSTILFDLFNIVPVLFFKAEHMDIGYSIGFVLRMYACGITFIYFYRQEKGKGWACIIGGLSYAFCSWGIGSMMHAFFLYPMVLLPLIVAGINKVYRKQSPWLLITTISLLIIFSWYFTYMTGLVLAVYTILSYKDYRNKKFLITITKFVLFVMVAIMLSAVITIPTLYALLNASKDASTSQMLFHTLKSYLLLPASFAAGNEVFGNYSFTAINGLFLALIPCFFYKENISKTPVLMWLICLMFLTFPVFCRILNGFSYAVGRWMFIMAFFNIWAGLEAVRSVRKVHAGWLLAAGSVFAIDCIWLKLLILSNELTFIVNIAVAVLMTIIIANGNRDNTTNANRIGFMVTCGICINIIIVSNLRFLPAFGPGLDKAMEEGELYNRAARSSQRVATQIQDDSFFRNFCYKNPLGYRLVHVPMNDNAFWGTKSIYEYLSTLDHRWHDFNKSLGNSAGYSQRIAVYGNDNRTRLDFLMGVKYYIGDSEDEGVNDYAGYGYKSSDVINGTPLLETGYSIGLGAVFDKAVLRSDFEELNYAEKEECLMQAAVVEDSYADALREILVTTDSIRFNSYTEEVNMLPQDHLSVEGNKIVASEDGTLKLTFDSVKDCELFLVLHDFKKNVSEANTALSLADRQYENFNLIIKDGIKVKRIADYSGTNQAFSNINDYCVNMGYYENSPAEITVEFQVAGTYEFGEIEIIVLPIKDFASQASNLMANSFIIDEFNATHVSGKTNQQGKGLLYLSILDNPGWQVFVNGTKKEKINNTDIAFTGVMLDGKSKIELKYRPPHIKIGAALTLIGIVLVAAYMLYLKRTKNEEE